MKCPLGYLGSQSSLCVLWGLRAGLPFASIVVHPPTPADPELETSTFNLFDHLGLIQHALMPRVQCISQLVLTWSRIKIEIHS